MTSVRPHMNAHPTANTPNTPRRKSSGTGINCKFDTMGYMGLMEVIRQYAVPRGSAALWFLGQNGFIFKSAAGAVIGVDLYLTNSCAATAKNGMNMNRAVPVLIEPEELSVDYYVVTHNHQDHTDPETIARLGHKDTARFVGPNPSC